MKVVLNKVIAAVIISVSLIGCNREVAPGSFASRKVLSNEDEAKYSYLLAEGLRMKLIGNQADALQFFELCIELDNSKAEPYYNISQIALQGGQIAEAVKNAEKAASLAPDNLWYVRYAGGVCFQTGEVAKAISYYEKATLLDPENMELLLTLSNLYEEGNKLDKAEKILEAIESKYGVNEKSSPSLARVKLFRKEYTAAEKIILALISSNPGNLEYHTKLAELYTIMGDRTKAMEVYNTLIEENGNDGEIQISLLQFLLEEKADDEIVNLLNAIVLNETIPVVAKNEILFRILEFEDLLKTKANEIELIIRIHEAAVENPDLQTSVLRPEFFIKQNRTGDAIGRLEELILIYGENQYLVERVLMLYYEDGNMSLLLERGKILAPKVNRSVIAKMLLAIAANDKGDYGLAISEAKKATILAAGNQELMVQIISIEADALYKSGKIEEAFATFERALELNPKETIILNNYAYFLAENDAELKKALSMIEVVMDAEPSNNTYLDTYAWVLYKLGKTKKAGKIMAEIMAGQGEKVADHYEHYGYILKVNRKCGEAVIYWNKALEMNPGNEKLREEIENCTR